MNVQFDNIHFSDEELQRRRAAVRVYQNKRFVIEMNRIIKTTAHIAKTGDASEISCTLAGNVEPRATT